MYAIIPQQIPQGMRAEVNEKILFAVSVSAILYSVLK